MRTRYARYTCLRHSHTKLQAPHISAPIRTRISFQAPVRIYIHMRSHPKAHARTSRHNRAHTTRRTYSIIHTGNYITRTQRRGSIRSYISTHEHTVDNTTPLFKSPVVRPVIPIMPSRTSERAQTKPDILFTRLRI